MALISKSTILKYRQISKSVDETLINQSINDAELLDLKPLLGELLYNDLVTNIVDAKYQDLMVGKSYTYDGKNYDFKGLEAVLANFSYARYIVFSSFVDTPFGLVTKNSQDSQAVSESNKRAMSKSAEQTAYSYFNSIRDFLNRSVVTYPLWDSGTTQRVFRINKISV